MSSWHRKQVQKRRLSMEVLEGRRLLAVGVIAQAAPPQNYGNPEDVNYDNQVTALDVLLVINRLNDPDRGDSLSAISTDIDGDGAITPRDALLIINRVNDRSDKSSVPPEQRAIGLEQSLDAGIVPPNMTLEQAEEMLETLKRGGYYEAGDRYRNGQMLNINRKDDGVSNPLGEGEHTEPVVAQEDTTDNEDPTAGEPLNVDPDDPFLVLQSPGAALSSELHESTKLVSTLECEPSNSLATDDSVSSLLYDRLAQRFSSVETREQLVQAISDAISDGDKSAEQIIDELRALRSTLGNAHSQIAQMFSNLDIDQIIEQLGIDLGRLAEAVLAHGQDSLSEREAIFAEFLGREYLDALGISLP